MNMLQLVLLFVVLALSYPAGIILARVTREELKDGRKAFSAMIISAFIVIVISFFSQFALSEKLFIASSMIFISAISYISLKRSYRSKRSKKIGKRKRRK